MLRRRNNATAERATTGATATEKNWQSDRRETVEAVDSEKVPSVRTGKKKDERLLEEIVKRK
jgi:hypothetical protein